MGDNGSASEHALLILLLLLILIQKAGASEHASDNSVRWPIVDSPSAPGHQDSGKLGNKAKRTHLF